MAKAAVPGTPLHQSFADGSRPVIVLDKFPPCVNIDDITTSIDQRTREYAWKTLSVSVELPGHWQP